MYCHLHWCIVIYYVMYYHLLLCFITFILLLLTCLFSYARYLEKAFMLCLLRVPLYLWDTTSLLVRLIWSHFHELYCICVCFSCLVLSFRRFMWLCPLHTLCDLFSHWSFHVYVGRLDFWLVSFIGVSSLDLGFVDV